MKYDGILLLSDLDGTFLNDDVLPVKANFDAVKRFTENGGLFSIATGRPPVSALRYIDGCNVNFPAVLFNGAMIYDFAKEKTEYTVCPSNEVRNAVYSVFEQYRGKVGFLAYYADKLVTVKRNTYSELMEQFEALPFCEMKNLEEFPDGVVKYLFVAEEETINELLERFASFGDILRYTSAGKNFCEILAPKADKGTTMMKMLEMHKSEIKKVIAIGDYYNDLCILEKADIKAVVKGAPKELTDIADYVTAKTNNEGAVADLIDNLEEILNGKA